MAKKKRAAKSTKQKTSAKVTAGSNKFDADQKTLVEDVDDRVPQIDTIVKKIVEAKSKRSALKEEIDGWVDKLPVLFKKHGLHEYSCHGKRVVIVPGGDQVKIQKAQSK